MKKQHLNYIIDILMLLIMLAIASIGFVIKYVLVSGSQRWEIYGNNVEQTFWGMDRHGWGDVHLVLGIALLVLLMVHIILHFNWIICMTKKAIPVKPLRYAIVSASLILILLCSAFPFIIKHNIQTSIHKEYHAREVKKDIEPEQHNTDVKKASNVQQKSIQSTTASSHQIKEESSQKTESENSWENIDVKGYMTFAEIEAKYEIPSEIIIHKLNLPSDTPNNERLGRIKKTRDFTMEEIKIIIYNFQKGNK